MNQRFDPTALFVDDRMEEVVVVPCGGCSQGQIDAAALDSLLPDGVCVSLPSLIAGAVISQRRLELAHAVIGLSACGEACTHKLLQSMRALDFHLDVSNISDPSAWVSLVKQQIDMLCVPEEETEMLPAGVSVSASKPLDLTTQQALSAAAVKLDFTGLRCPMPIVQLSKHCRESDDIHLEVSADDRAFPADVRAWCKQRGARLVNVDEEKGVYTARILLMSTERKRSTRNIQVQEPPAPGPAPSLDTLTSLPASPFLRDDEALPVLERIDCMSMRSPLQIVELQKALARHTTPGTLVLHTLDSQFMEDVEHWCRQSDAVLLNLDADPERIEAIIAVNLNQRGIDISSVEELTSQELRETIQSSPSFPMPVGENIFEEEYTDPHGASPAAQISTVLDYTGLRCPMPIVRLAQAARQLTPALFQVKADDPAFPQDLRAWCEQHGYEILGIEMEGPVAVATVSPPGLSRSQSGPMKPASLPAKPASFPIRPLTRSVQMKRPDLTNRQRSPSGVSERPQLGQGSRPNGGAVPPKRQILQGRPEDMAQIRTGEVLKVSSLSEEQDFASSGKQVVPLEQPSAEGLGVDLTTNARLSRLSLGAIIDPAALKSRETTEFPLHSHPRALQDLLPQSEPSKPPKGPPAKPPEAPPAEPVSLDLTGLKCPLPIVRLSSKVREMPGRVFSVKADDAAFPPDLRAWCGQSNMHVLSLETTGRVHTAVIGPPGSKAPQSRNMDQLYKLDEVLASSQGPVSADSDDEFPYDVGSNGSLQAASLFAEMQSFWDNELPTQPISAVAVKQAKECDLRGFSTMDCIDKLKDFVLQQDEVLHVKLDPSISVDNFQVLCELNNYTCVAANTKTSHAEVWLQRTRKGK